MASRWAGPDEPRRDLECFGPMDRAGPWNCDCDGASEVVDAQVSCEEALETACGIDAGAPADFCESPVGTCWPGISVESFRCRCGTDARGVDGVGPDCQHALFDACAAACEDEAGRCAPSAVGPGFDCTCTTGPEPFTLPGLALCTDVLSSCHPVCEQSNGACFPNNFDPWPLCHCDGEEGAGPGDSESCRDALIARCGPDPALPEPQNCEHQGARAHGACRIDGDAYFCTCSTNESEEAGSPVEESCEALLRGLCPEAYE